MKGWIEKTLGALGTIGRGRSRHRPRDAKHLYGGPYPFIQTADVKRANLYIDSYSQTYSDAGLAQSKLWEPGTLCITIAANIAETAILKIQACFPDSVIGFIPHEKISDVRFVKYIFDAILKKKFEAYSKGSTQDNLSQEKILSLKFFVPAFEVQQKIGDILSAYDDLIENNRRRIQLLEESARLLYKEWFVRLRFPGHEHVKVVDGVPEGWEKKKLFLLADIVMGQSPDSKFYNYDRYGLPFHQGVKDFGYRFPKNTIFCTKKQRIAEYNDILFSVRAPVGRINIAKEKIIIGRGLSAIRSKEHPQNFLFYALKSMFFKDNIMGSGTIYSAISKNDLLGIEILLPEKSIMEQFSQIAGHIDRQIEVLSYEAIKLAQARDLLLPKLMSGEVTV